MVLALHMSYLKVLPLVEEEKRRTWQGLEILLCVQKEEHLLKLENCV